MSRILVLGGSGEMASVAVADLITNTDHEVTIGDIRDERARELLRTLSAPERVIHVDVEDPSSLNTALDGFDLVLNATYMRHNLPVTDAVIGAGIHMVDLGSYYVETQQQMERGDEARARGCRIVPGCGVAPGLTNIIARFGCDKLDQVDSVRMYSYITHPLWTSPGIVITRFDACSGASIVFENGELVEKPSFGDEERVTFPEPYGEQEVHLAPHPESVTLPRYVDTQNVVFKVGYTADENARLKVLLELGFDGSEAFTVDNNIVVPRRFASAYIGRRGIGPNDRSANVKQVWVDGARAGEQVSLVYDFAVEEVGRSASSRITGTVAAIAANLVARAGVAGVHPPEGGLDAAVCLNELAKRGLDVRERELAYAGASSLRMSKRPVA